MKNKCLSLIMAVCVFSAFPGVLDCRCVEADCGAVPQAIQTETSRCHPAASHAKGENSSRKECCRKCRIEKAAVLENKFVSAKGLRPEGAPAETKPSIDLYSNTAVRSSPGKEILRSPPGFFTQHILNATFSFRAPPLALAL